MKNLNRIERLQNKVIKKSDKQTRKSCHQQLKLNFRAKRKRKIQNFSYRTEKGKRFPTFITSLINRSFTEYTTCMEE